MFLDFRKKNRAPEGNPHKHWDSMKTLYRKAAVTQHIRVMKIKGNSRRCADFNKAA